MHAPDDRVAILAAGLNLRGLRERLGLTMREVESASARIAERHGNDEFGVSPSRLSDIKAGRCWEPIPWFQCRTNGWD